MALFSSVKKHAVFEFLRMMSQGKRVTFADKDALYHIKYVII